MTLAAHGVSVAGRLIDADATIAPARLTAIVGPNGAGKSTLAKVLAGLLVPTGGSVTIAGQPLTALTGTARARAIGYLAQGGAVAWNIAARDVVALGRVPHGDHRAATGLAAIASALTAADVAHLADRPVQAMSGGERARVLLARVIAGDPAWLIADEPLANLDPPHQAALLRQLRAHADAGCGVVTVLHDLNAAMRADQVLIMRAGRIIAAGPPVSTLTPAVLQDAFAMAFWIVRDDTGSFIAATE